MNEEQIRELEIEAAKAMGWEVRKAAPDYNLWGLWGPGMQEIFTGGFARNEAEVQSLLQDYVPLFARDPAAILEALEWTAEARLFPSGHYDVSPRKVNGKWFVLADKTNERDRRVISEGETLGIAILRAIIALKT